VSGGRGGNRTSDAGTSERYRRGDTESCEIFPDHFLFSLAFGA
jgi:hypothetical protein